MAALVLVIVGGLVVIGVLIPSPVLLPDAPAADLSARPTATASMVQAAATTPRAVSEPVRFLATGDVHMYAECCSAAKYSNLNGEVRYRQLHGIVKEIAEKNYGRGLVVAGDLMSFSHRWEFFLYKWTVTGNTTVPDDDQFVSSAWRPDHKCPTDFNLLCYPNGGWDKYVFDGLGNHDVYFNSASPNNDDTYGPRKEISNRHREADAAWKCWELDWPGGKLPSNNEAPSHDNCAHYSWNWGGVHFVQLHLAPTDGRPYPVEDGEFYTDNAETFLKQDLAQNVGNSGMPVIIIHHLGFDPFSTGMDPASTDGEWWTEAHREAYWDTIANYNVIGILTGHSHGPPEMIKWDRPGNKTNGPPFIRTFKVGSLQGAGDPRGEDGYFSEFEVDANQLIHKHWLVKGTGGGPWSFIKEDSYDLRSTPPSVSLALSGMTPNAEGWYRRSPSLTISASDGFGIKSLFYRIDSGVATKLAFNPGTFSGTVPPLGDGIRTVYYWAEDEQGNLSAEQALQLKIDSTPPELRIKMSPAANSNGWHNTDVVVSAECADAVSGLASACPGPVTFTQEGAGQAGIATVYDRAGNEARVEYVVSIDSTPPELRIKMSPAANANGWHNTDVVVSAECADAVSRLASACPGPVTFTKEGAGQAGIATVYDLAGNEARVEYVVNIDKAAPSTAIDADSTTVVYLGGDPRLRGSAQDALAGVGSTHVAFTDSIGRRVTLSAECDSGCRGTSSRWSVSLAGLRPGTYRVTARSTDLAGNRGNESRRVTLVIVGSGLA